MNQSDDAAPQQSSFWKSKAGLVAIAFLLIAAFLLLSEHRAHLLGYLPFLLLLACPLLHLFMHGGHGGHGWSAVRPDPWHFGHSASASNRRS